VLYQPLKLKEIEEIRRCKEASESTKKKMIRCREQLFVRRIEIELDRLMMDHFNRAEVLSTVGSSPRKLEHLARQWNVKKTERPEKP